uniref:Nephrocystin 4 n=1 Tax=Salmo trutta TaxID=8032 RepID=A0A674EM24_SALTR
MTDDWKGLFERGRVIPPHSQTVRQAQDSSHTHSQGFQIILKHLDGPHIQRVEGSRKREPVKYQLSVSLFDTSHQHFFGRTWKSSPQQMSGVNRAMFNEVVYLHTSLRLPSVVAVVELVALQPRADGSQHALGCGFAILHLFSSMTEPQATEGDRRLSLYHGTPRTLLHPLLRDPIEQNKLLTPIDGAHLVCSLKPHPALAPAMHLFPQNMLVSGDENIPGVTPSPTGDSLLKPHMVKSLTCFLDRLSISLHPSLEKFESQLLQHVSTDCHNTKHSGPESSAVVVIQERRLHVGVHNGWGFLERPQVVVLETTEATDCSRGRKATSRYPTMSHSTAVSPWQQPFSSQLYPSPLASAHQLSHVELPAASNITHLEVDLNSLQELPFTPIHAPIITMGTHAASSSVSSRSSLAHLYSASFPYITDPSGLVAEVLDPTEPVNFDPQREEADPLQGNVLLLQFLAFSRIPQQGGSSNWPDSVHFTFQLYRFPPVTTQRLKLLAIDKLPKKSSETPPCVLAVINKDGTVNSGSPGLQLQFRVDGAFLQPGERRWFLRYLALHTLQVDVWDSQSLLLIGSTALGLKHMLRQGRPAVQATHELEVITTEYMGEGVPVSLHRASNPISVFTTIKGRLHLRLGNVGKDESTAFITECVAVRLLMYCCKIACCECVAVRNAARAQRLVELDGDLVPLLQSHMKEGGGTPRTNTPWWGETDDVRQRKLNRMVAVRQHEGGQDAPILWSLHFYLQGRRAERAQLARDLRLMHAYRERSKAEGITHILSQAITIHHTLYATLGTAEYLEYVLRNPFNTPQTVTIYSEDPDVITDCDEWRYFKTLTKTLTPLEEDMFHLKEGTLAPQVYLRPKESVHVPLKYQTFVSDNSVVPQVAKKHLSNTVLAKSIKVTFRAEDGKPLAICQVSVEPTPHVIDQTFRFYQPELSFLKKALRLPPWERTPVGDTDAGSQISVRCSDPNVICETKMLAQGEPQDVYLKVPGSPSPQIRKFFVTVFTDKWLAVPAQVWQVYVHFLQRVDISCVTGQRTCQSLVIRGTQATRKVRCYTSHPQELKVDPAEVFVLLPGVVQDLQLCVCPLRAGSRFCYLTVVDVEQHTLVACWLLSLTCRLPILSKAFEMCAPVGGGRGSTRKITYTNPYPTSRVLLLRSDHPDLLQFKEDRFEIGGGETYRIGLRFAPSQSPGAQEILIYINNQEEITEETFCVKVKYT